MFSHCGIVIKKDSVFEIAHILGGYTNPKGTIIIEPVKNFFLILKMKVREFLQPIWIALS